MLQRKLFTKNYKHEDHFVFKGQKYNLHSIVLLTEEGRLYLGAATRQVILTECFLNHHLKNPTMFWKYEFRSSNITVGITDASTSRPPDELIEEVVVPSTEGYAEREKYGIYAPSYKEGRAISKKDSEIPGMATGWIVWFLVSVFSFLFKDYIVVCLIQVINFVVFNAWRAMKIQMHTIYVHDEDAELLKNKYETLYK